MRVLFKASHYNHQGQREKKGSAMMVSRLADPSRQTAMGERGFSLGKLGARSNEYHFHPVGLAKRKHPRSHLQPFAPVLSISLTALGAGG
jgi:hypothetical protein